MNAELPIWNYDGSSTGQSTGANSDTYLHPVAIYKDPFRRGNNILVLCDTYKFDGAPTGTNKRRACLDVVTKCANEEPWFGIEQVLKKIVILCSVLCNAYFKYYRNIHFWILTGVHWDGQKMDSLVLKVHIIVV